MNKKRLVGIDIFRILCAVITLAFHTRMHLKLTYGVIDSFIFNGAIVMTAFFVISGFSLHYIYSNKPFNRVELRHFYLKRIINIFPGYYAAALLFLIHKKHTFIDNLFLAPIEALGIQTVFSHAGSKLTHNGGTWFISCLILCYFAFPPAEMMLKECSRKTKLFVFLMSVFILLYSPFFIKRFSLEVIYSNPFFRGLEFLIGIILADCYKEFWLKGTDKKQHSVILSIVKITIELFLLIAGVQFVLAKGWIKKQDYMMLSIVSLPIFLFMTITLANVELRQSRVISYLNEIAYPFFLAQLFIWKPLRRLYNILDITDNLQKILAAFLLCTIMAISLHEIIEKPIQKLLRRKWQL